MDTPNISDAVILMAGAGSRLGVVPGAIAKPLVQISGRPLISYSLEALECVGVRTVHAVMGANSDRLTEEIEALLPASMRLNPIINRDWQKQNGVSVLAAAGKARAPFFLLMGDHLFDPAILPLLIEQATPGDLLLAVDKKIESIFDIDDAMKVQTDGERVVTLAKTLELYDAIDTGIFLCPEELFDYLRNAQRNGDCSLADGVRLMAAAAKVRAIDIGAGWWQDVDTPEMLAHAEENLGNLALRS